MNFAHAPKLDLQLKKTNFAAQKIENSSLEIYGMVITVFQVLNKLNYLQIF